MFDKHAQRVIASLPQLHGLDPTTCRRTLSAAYLIVVQQRLSPASSPADVTEVRRYLRRLVDALESVAVFDRLAGKEVTRDTERSAAFVAAEALSLLVSLPPPISSDIIDEIDANPELPPSPNFSDGDIIQNPSIYLCFEAALLYFISGYEINGAALTQGITKLQVPLGSDIQARRKSNAIYLTSRLRDLVVGNLNEELVPQHFTGFDTPSTDYASIVSETRLLIYRDLGLAITGFLRWLGGDNASGYEQALAKAMKVRVATAAERAPESTELPYLGPLQRCAEFADMFHLSSLLYVAFERSSERSFFHRMPRPSVGPPTYLAEFESYCSARVRHGRPFLWPTAIEFIEKSLPGFARDAVISMPTGSGKSSVAEIAIVHALARGSVIYLAPTNALVHQIRRDLERALEAFGDVEVIAFVGSGEYTRLAEEQLLATGQRFIGVLTPEKCALAMRLTPEVFSDCSLCIFDECHLINDAHRGVVADLLIAELFQTAPGIRVLLMSAMVGNAGELSEWLQTARGGASYHSETQWRPSRTLRGLIVVNRPSATDGFTRARTELVQALTANKRRKNWLFDVELALVAGLSGPWSNAGALDYRAGGLDVAMGARASIRATALKTFLGKFGDSLRAKDGHDIVANFESWKNVAGRIVAERFARSGISTINFILTSRHHAFSCAKLITSGLPGSVGTGSFPPIVEAWLSLADAELGQPTALRGLLATGVAVHTSAMLQVEQAAAEWMFKEKLASLMFATGTLAQGLNLPAVAVVVSGTSMGDPRETDKIAGIGRTEAMILNAFGRAGRPGFSNQGLAILVSDEPFTAVVKANLDGGPALQAYPQLGLIDAAVTVGSPIEHFIDQMAAVGTDLSAVPEEELELVTQLAEAPTDGLHAGEILRKTFGGFRKRSIFTDELSARLRDRIAAIRKDYFEAEGVPSWLNRAAMEAGVDFFRAQRIRQSYTHRGLVALEEGRKLSIAGWCKIFFEVMRGLPPRRVRGYMADEETKTPSMLTRLRDAGRPILEVDEVPWQAPKDWANIWSDIEQLTVEWLDGASYTALAQRLFDTKTIPPDRSSGKLPAIFALTRDVFESLARDAGCFVSVIEHEWRAAAGHDLDIVEDLEALPLCLRSGCGTIGSLSWYRFGYRQRYAAHFLAKVYPLPPESGSDAQRRDWVRSERRESLLNAQNLTLIDPLLESIRTILVHEHD